MGCGPSGIDGWQNYDWGVLPLLSKMPLVRSFLVKIGWLSASYVTKWPEIRLVNIVYRLPLESESVDYIYCSHVLEHFEKYEGVTILKECARVLKKGGIMRIVLPDLNKLVNNYKGAEKFNRDFYGFDKDKKSMTKIFIRSHQWMYDLESITKLLKANFEVKERSFGRGKVPDLDKLDLESHRNHSLYIEAIK